MDSPRTIAHLDVDAFYVAVERELRPDLRDRPVAVSQYNPYGDLRDCPIDDPERVLYDGQKQETKRHPNANGSLIAVSYEARARNVKRNDRGLEAVRKCPELAIVQVPVLHGKANLSIYRDASERLMTVLLDLVRQSAMDLYQELNTAAPKRPYSLPKKSIPLEKASIDEIYLDISTPVQNIMEVCTENKAWGTLHKALTREGSASTHTTIGGLETRQAAIATNSLSKDDIRRGSSLQVLDSEGAIGAKDEAGKAWWGRSFPAEWSDVEIALAIGSLITLQARHGIVKKFDGIYTFSSGTSTNKTMAKLASGLKKPNRQTLCNPNDETTLQKLFHPLPLGRIRGLGGKLGDKIGENLQIKTVGELKKIPLTTLQDKVGAKQAQFLFRIAQGICDEEVTERSKPKCVGAGKTFQGVLSIHSSDQVKLKKWIGNLVSDIIDRIEGDKTRYAKTLVVWLNMAMPGGDKQDRRRASQSAPLPRIANVEKHTAIALNLANEIVSNTSGKKDKSGEMLIVGMSVTATNFVSIAQGSKSILDAFQRASNADHSLSPRPTKSLDRTEVMNSMASKSKPVQIVNPYAKAPLVEITQIDKTLTAKQSPNKEGSDQETNTADSSDLEHARALQMECDEQQGRSNAEASQLPAQNLGEETSCLEAICDDPDLEYARQLQASFDRENEVIANMEKRRSSISPNPSSGRVKRVGKRRKLSVGSKPISSFFGKKE